MPWPAKKAMPLQDFLAEIQGEGGPATAAGMVSGEGRELPPDVVAAWDAVVDARATLDEVAHQFLVTATGYWDLEGGDEPQDRRQELLRAIMEAEAENKQAKLRTKRLIVAARSLVPPITYRDLGYALSVPESTVSGTRVPAAFRDCQ